MGRDSRMKAIFGGVYPRDKVPSIPKDDTVMYIWNTDDHNQAGTHWVLTGNWQKCVIYADPLGRAYSAYGVSEWIRKPGLPIVSFSRKIQSDNSVMCGGFCIMFLWLLSRNYGIREIEQLFSLHPVRNDQIVQRFLWRKLGVNLGSMLLA